MNSEQLLERVFHCIEEGWAPEAGLWARLLVRQVREEERLKHLVEIRHLEHHAVYCQQCQQALLIGIFGNSLCPEGERIYAHEN